MINKFVQSVVNSVSACSVVSLLMVIAVTDPSIGQQVDFAKHIRPILSRHCLACHGPDEGHRQAGLRLDTFAGASESAIVVGEPEASELILRVTTDDEEVRMPPTEHGKSLTTAEIEMLRAWIKAGAKYQMHWAFVKPTKIDPPRSSKSSWAFNEIDAFIAKRLEQQTLSHSVGAAPHRLIRRLALDLTGLPPSSRLAKKYAENPTDDTYEQIVNELLASPAYGEHWAAMWLDIARYADTTGYAEDRDRTIWPWRDWVIDAFNRNLPYDRFTVEQIAGDLLTEPADSQVLATAFHRNTLSNSEGGTSDEEFRTIAVKDRISTTVNVWMGLTMRCAECHTHKYDPISQTEYYQFLAFFNQTEDSDRNDEHPTLAVHPLGREFEAAATDKKIAALKLRWTAAPPVWQVLKPMDTASRNGSEFQVLDDHSILAVGEVPNEDEYSFSFKLPAIPVSGLRLELIPDPSHGGNVGRSLNGSILISQIRATTKGGDQSNEHEFVDATADHSQKNHPVKHLIRSKADDTGWAVGHPQAGYRVKREAILEFKQPIKLDSCSELTVHILQKSRWPQTLAGRLRLSATSIKNPANKYRGKELDPLAQQISQLQRQRDAAVQVPVMRELPADQQRKTYVMIRGSYLNPGEEVESAVMSSFHPLPANAPANRLGIANWIMSDENPLTARVTVNRFWSRIFGVGIVETEEDFGTQGALPTHPDLLDWLAIDFQEQGWNVKRLLKQMVMSATYRQTNKTNSVRLAKDPRNRFYSRGPRVRLRGEAVRDQALAVSGLLSKKMYGSPVYPPNPVKRTVNAFTGGKTWTVSTGEDRYRRAIYTYLKRSQPHPLFDTFDVATREVCNLRRIRTNTPLQSFMTMNDEVFIECARELALQMRKHSVVVENQLKFGLETALVRPAEPDQIKILQQLYDETQQKYLVDAHAARQITGNDNDNTNPETLADIATLTVVANVILNLDSFLTK